MQYRTVTTNSYQYANVITPRNTICNLTQRISVCLGCNYILSYSSCRDLYLWFRKDIIFLFFFLGKKRCTQFLVTYNNSLEPKSSRWSLRGFQSMKLLTADESINNARLHLQQCKTSFTALR